jgi:hypothetical protein
MILVIYHPITDEIILYTNADAYKIVFPYDFYEFSLEDALLEGFTLIGEL